MLMGSIAMMAVVSLASCSANSDFDNTNTTDLNTKESVLSPVEFGTYLAQSKNTRGGENATASASDASEMTTDKLKTKGFGVIAFYTESTEYTAGQNTTEPNFMYNTDVTGKDGDNGVVDWTYEPIKYWPNGGQGDATKGDATPENKTQYLSFFAYAPYKNVDKTTGSTGSTPGITALSANDSKSDPTVTYVLGATGAEADLLWGTAGSNGTTTSGVDQTGTDFSDKAQVKAKAKVNANLTKMKVGGKVQFNFKHALAKFGGTGAGSGNKTSGLMVVADIDNGTATTGGTLDATTKITVKSIKIESVKASDDGKTMTTEASIPTSGTLNLVTGVWSTTDAKMGKIDYEINSPKATVTTGATIQTLNDDIAEPASFSSWGNLPEGVTATAKSVYTETNPLLIIPDGGNYTFRITIDYIVRTKDEALKDGYTQVEQSFYKDLTLKTVSLNAKYNLLIHLGLTSVKFDATVSDWTNSANGGTTSDTSTDKDPMEIDMPANVK